MWHYVTIFDDEYGINVRNVDNLGDGSESGLRITVHPVNAVTGDTNLDKFDSLKVEPLALSVCKLRLKLKGRK
jgi:hypothetical protein